MKTRASVVIIGGGIAGASIALHLARLGRTDVLVLEQGELISGTTSHAPGLIGQLRSSVSLTRLLVDSVALYRTLELDGAPGFLEVGSLRLASSRERLIELRQQKAFADRCGLDTHLLSPAETLALFPLMDKSGVEGAIYMPTDGSAAAPVLAGAMIRDARALGVEFESRTRVTSIEVASGAVRGVTTESGRCETETLVIAAGIWSPLIGRMAGVSIPLTPMEHQYVETESIPTLGQGMLPNLRDPDNLVYLRQKGDSLIAGGYERNPRAFTATIPRNENPTVQQFDSQQFAGLLAAAGRRVPEFARHALAHQICGLESFTPDGAFLLGPTPEVRGVWTACGFCAHGVSGGGGVGKLLAEWIVSGTTSIDPSGMAIARFAGQNLDESEVRRRACETYATYYDMTTGHAEGSA
ncbi:MAG TPA: FAD-binding oxidoreductase [Pirellulales bacterium]|jgi:4-methylaminobutanoate oxidase (formaldehyde-forming)